MKVKQLVKQLKALDQEKEIFMSSDREGNIVNYISDVDLDHEHYIIYPTDDSIETVGLDTNEQDYNTWYKGYLKWLKQLEPDENPNYHKDEPLSEDESEAYRKYYKS